MRRTSSLILRTCAGVVAIACSGAPVEPTAPPQQEVSPTPSTEEQAPATAATTREVTPDTIVRASFETTAQGLRPGKSLLLAVHLSIHDGYRIFWKNPGEVGKRTLAHFSAPEGFEVSEVMYPKPERYRSKTGVVSYGYEGETALFVEVRAPRGLDPQKAYRFDAQAEWFACKKQCSGERIEAFFEMVADPQAQSGQFEAPLDSLLASVPVPISDLANAKHRWTLGGTEATLSLSAPRVEWLDFYPETRENPRLLGVSSSAEQLTLSYEAPDTPPETVKGMAIAKVNGREAYFDVAVPWDG